MKTFRIIRVLISCLFAALFLFSGAYKWGTMDYFYKNVVRNPIPEGLVPYVAYGLPTTLLILGMLIVMDVFKLIKKITPYLLTVSVLLIGLLSLYCHLILIDYFDKPRPCSCSGILGMDWAQHRLFNSFFALLGTMALMLYFLEKYTHKVERYLHKIQVKFATWLKKRQTSPLNF